MNKLIVLSAVLACVLIPCTAKKQPGKNAYVREDPILGPSIINGRLKREIAVDNEIGSKYAEPDTSYQGRVKRAIAFNNQIQSQYDIENDNVDRIRTTRQVQPDGTNNIDRSSNNQGRIERDLKSVERIKSDYSVQDRDIDRTDNNYQERVERDIGSSGAWQNGRIKLIKQAAPIKY